MFVLKGDFHHSTRKCTCIPCFFRWELTGQEIERDERKHYQNGHFRVPLVESNGNELAQMRRNVVWRSHYAATIAAAVFKTGSAADCAATLFGTGTILPLSERTVCAIVNFHYK